MINWLKQFISEWAPVLVIVFVISAVGTFFIFSAVINSILDQKHRQAKLSYNTLVAYHIEKLKGVDNVEDHWNWCSRE